MGITSTETPTLAPGTVIRADITAANLDPKLRLAIGSGAGKAIGIILPEGFEYREIPPTPKQFEFQRVNIQGKWEFQVYGQGELLGTVEKSSQARAASMVGSAVSGEYSRGQYTGKNANGGLKMNVTALVEHQLVAREMRVAVEIDKSISWGDGQSAESSSPAPQMYQPNRGELLRWYGSSRASGDSELQQVALEAGQRLAAEFKATGAGEMPPRDYSSTNVLVPANVREQMERIVKEQEVVVNPRFEVQVREEPAQAKSVDRGR